MVVFSRRRGTMVHCTVYCPIGLVGDWLGKLNPFQIRIEPSACTECMVCARVCRYGALELSDICAGKPSLTCTLCTDCMADCPTSNIQVAFPGLLSAAAATSCSRPSSSASTRCSSAPPGSDEATTASPGATPA